MVQSEPEEPVLSLHCHRFIMSRVKQLLKKLEVDNEPGLNNAQLMLMNNDLRPGEIVEKLARLISPYDIHRETPSCSPLP